MALAMADPEKLLWITIVLTFFVGTTRSLPEIIKIGKVSDLLHKYLPFFGPLFETVDNSENVLMNERH